MEVMEDVIVCGSGAAGLAAATWLGRYRRKTLVLDGGPPRNAAAHASHGYLGRDGEPPEALLEQARRDLERYSTVEICPGEATNARRIGPDFGVTTSEGERKCHRILLATGVEDVRPDIPGVEDLYGTSIFHCSCCDGYESSDLDVLAIGWGEHVAGFALDLLEWGARVTLVTNGKDLQTDDSCHAALDRNGIEIADEPISSFLVEDGKMQAVELESGRVLKAARAFFSIKHEPRNSLARQLGCELDEMGYVKVGEHGETSVEGVYAAGDVTPGEQLVQRAASEGAISGIACALSLRGMKTGSRAPEPGPDPEAELSTD